MIPCNGIFLSLFFLFRLERPPGCNFLMGLMLLALSCLSALQLVQSLASTSQPPAPYYFLNELSVSPFLFLYTFNLHHPARKSKIWFHLVFIALNLTFLFWVNLFNALLIRKIINVFILVNGLYLLASLFTTLVSWHGKSGEPRPDPASGYKSIYILHLLVIGAALFCIMWHEVGPDRLVSLAQLSKGLVIYYIYIKILDKAVFTG